MNRKSIASLALALISLTTARFAQPAAASPAEDTGAVAAPLLLAQADYPTATAKTEWLTSYEQAVRQSKSTGKPIMMDFTGSNWCGWCMKLKKEVFETDQFKKWASHHVVLLELDFPRGIEQPANLKKQNQELAAKYQIQGYPTIIFINADGQALGNYGYDAGGPTVWLKKAGELISKR
jgi:protein disulfide-isomerase